MTEPRVNPNCRLEDQGITGFGNAYYNLLEPALIEAAKILKEPVTVQIGMIAPAETVSHALYPVPDTHKSRLLPVDKLLRIETLAPAQVHWSSDGWQTVVDTDTRDTGLGLHVVDLPTSRLPPGTIIRFTFYWPEARRWEGTDFATQMGAGLPPG